MYYVSWDFEQSGSVGTIVQTRPLKPSRFGVSSLSTSRKLTYSQKRQKGLIVSCVKTSEPKKIDGSNGEVTVIFKLRFIFIFILNSWGFFCSGLNHV